MAAEEEVIELASYETDEESVDEARPLRWWARGILIALTVPWIAVITTAICLYPYNADGEPLRLGTHQQLGLPPCSFKELVGIPCPSCGMTSSFSLLLHGDVVNSLKANFAGTVLVTFGLLFVPWAFASVFLRRFVFIRSLELVVFRLAIIFLVLLFGRWGIVLILDVLNRYEII